MPSGRPSKYTRKLTDGICRRMANGETLSAICRDEKMPAKSTVNLWIANDKDGFSDRYAKAYTARAWFLADELIDIADDGHNDYMEVNHDGDLAYKVNGEAVARSRLRVDTRKFLLSKLIPQFSDKPDQGIDKDSDLAEALNKLAEKLPD